VSDIDDTVKESHVTDRGELLANTFLREFRAVAGMAETYRTWAAREAVFHYVSASPYQLHEPLTRFLDSAGFPTGSMDMKRFRWKDSSVANLFASSPEIKRPAIEALLTAFPRRKFALVGDSGEEDPELYADLARNHPEQVVRVLIRDVAGDGLRSTRFAEAFRGLPRERWVVFREAAELRDVLDPYLDTEGRAAGADPAPPRREEE
jgi:phosphatidate phosphatase APP1